MRNKGAIRLLAIVFALVSLYQLTFTYVTKSVEKEAREFGAGDIKKEQAYLDSIRGEGVYNFLWIKDYSYKECKELELNLGLDLKGGMNVTMEVSVVDIIKAMNCWSCSVISIPAGGKRWNARFQFCARTGSCSPTAPAVISPT